MHKLSLVVSSAFILVSCGGGSGGGSGGSSTPPPPPPASNGAPSISSATSFSFNENDVFEFFLEVSDPENDNVTITVDGSGDGAFFQFDSTGRVIPADSFNFNFESPQDANGDNVYEQKLTLSDGTNTVNETILVTILDVNEPPTCRSGEAVSFNENFTGQVFDFQGMDPEGAAITYEITDIRSDDFFGLNDSYINAISVDANTGVLNIIDPLDFENENPDFDYDVDVTVELTAGSDKVACSVNLTLLDLPGVVQSGIRFSGEKDPNSFEKDQAVQFVGDIDGDSLSDVWLKNTNFDDNGYDQPNGNLIFGSALSAELHGDNAADIAIADLSGLTSIRIFATFPDPGDGSQGGGEEFNAIPAGDVDNDGIQDILITSRPTPTSQMDTIDADRPLGYLLWGDHLSVSGETEIDIGSLTAAQGLTILGPDLPAGGGTMSRRGLTATAGELDGDTQSDIVFSLPEFNTVEGSTQTYIIPGAALSASKTAGSLLPAPNADVVTFAEFGSNVFRDAGTNLSVINDVTGDGASELVISNRNDRTGILYSEQIAAASKTEENFYSTLNDFANLRRFEYNGDTGDTNNIFADIDGDDIPDLIGSGGGETFISFGTDLAGGPVVISPSIALPFGTQKVAALGDLDGDGFDEIAVGSGGSDGRVFVITGQRLMELIGPNGAGFDPNTLAAGEGLILVPSSRKNSIVFDMVALPDINGDGLSEISVQFVGGVNRPIETNIVLSQDLVAGLAAGTPIINLPDLFDLEIP